MDSNQPTITLIANSKDNDTEEKFKTLADYLDIKPQLEFLSSYGFNDLKKNLKVLHRYKYNQEKALRKLEEKANMDIIRKFKKIQKYQELFPEDKEIDWFKFKTNKNQQKNKRKEEKYKLLFTEDSNFDWDKFKANKHKLKKMKQYSNKFSKKKKDREDIILDIENIDIKIDENKEINQNVYKEFFPKDNKTDFNKLKKLNKETKLKIKEEKYKVLFPDDKEFDWNKFKKEIKEKKEKEKIFDKDLVEEWKNDYTSLYLDGNNMLYDESAGGFRNLDFKKLEKDVAALAENFAVKKKLQSLCIYFDYTKQVYANKIDNLQIVIHSARPTFKTSDDALVDFVSKMIPSTLETSVFVTQDKGLKMRLREKGVKLIMRPKKFMELARNESGGEEKYKELEPKYINESSSSGSDSECVKD